MMTRHKLLLAAIALAVVLLVSRRQMETEQLPVVSAPQPASAPATQAETVMMQVDQQSVLFPKAVLRLSVSKDHVNARLSSDDPPDAIQDNYHGNSFDLIMALNVSDPSQIDKAVWVYTSDPGAPGQRENSYGIFLDGQRRRLHPQNVVVSFARDGDRVIVDMKGVFFEYETADTGRATNVPPPRVLVQGRFEASVEKN